MAVDDESFYNVLGEEISRTYLVNQMIGYYELKKEIGETNVTDFTEGSEIRNLLESIAVDCYVLMQEENELTKVGFIDTAEGEFLDKHGANPFISLPRDLGQEATGFVTFKIPTELTEDVVIPEGTIVVCEDTELEYGTDNEAIISVGETETTVSCTCLSTGTEGNCPAESINLIDDEFVDVTGLTVTNEEKLSDGTDYEEDDEYRERLLSYVRQDDFGSLPYYYNLANSVEGVHDVLLIDEEVEEGESPVYTKIILVNGDTKETPNDVLLDVLETFTETKNIVVGHTFFVDKPSYQAVDLDLKLSVSVEQEETQIMNVLHDFFDGGGEGLQGYEFDGLSIGQSITKAELYEALFIISDIQEIVAENPTTHEEISEITVADEQTVLKVGTITITQTVES